MKNDRTSKRRRWFMAGPGILVTAAFVGPGTVMTASAAGARFGHALLWAVAFSVLATIVLQEMAARLGVITGQGLAETLHSATGHWYVRAPLTVLVLGGILFGNAAYQTGNLLGAATGLEMLGRTLLVGGRAGAGASALPANGSLVVGVAVLVLAMVWSGRFKFIQRTLTVLVAVMGGLFAVAAVISRPDWSDVARGFNPIRFFQRKVTGDEIWLVVGLIGTTVVPYNLFLHASAAARRWSAHDSPRAAIWQSTIDTIVSVTLGGLITASLLITGALAFAEGGVLEGVHDVAQQLRPALGSWADSIFGVGLFAAGFTSSVTAPIAAAWATAGCFGWPSDLQQVRLKVVATAVVATGTLCALFFGGSPKDAIIVAQVANGILLPIIASFLLVMMNRRSLMGQLRNGWFANLLGVIVVLLTAALSARMLRPLFVRILDWY